MSFRKKSAIAPERQSIDEAQPLDASRLYLTPVGEHLGCFNCSLRSIHNLSSLSLEDYVWNIFRILDDENRNFIEQERLSSLMKEVKWSMLLTPSDRCCRASNHDSCLVAELDEFFFRLGKTKIMFAGKRILLVHDFVALFSCFKRPFIESLHVFFWRRKHKAPGNYFSRLIEQGWLYNQLSTCQKERGVEVKQLGLIGVLFEAFKLRSLIISYADFLSSVTLLQSIYNAYIESNRNNSYAAPLIIKIVAIIGPFLIAYSAQIQQYLTTGKLLQLHLKTTPRYKRMTAMLFFSPLGLLYFFLIYNIQIFLEIVEIGFKLLAALLFCFSFSEKISAIGPKLKAKFYSKTYEEQDFKGLLEQLNMTRIVFESIPNLIIDACIAGGVIHTPEFAPTSKVLLISLALTILNIWQTLFTQIKIARFFKTDFLNYCLICMKARFGWQPFLEEISEGKLVSIVDYGCIRVPSIPFFGEKYYLFDILKWNFDDHAIKAVITTIVEKQKALQSTDYSGQQAIDISRSIYSISMVDLANLITLSSEKFKVIIHDLQRILEHTVSFSKLEPNWKIYTLSGNSLQYECIVKDGIHDYFNLDLFRALLHNRADPNPQEKNNGSYLMTLVLLANKNQFLSEMLRFKVDLTLVDPVQKKTAFEIAYETRNADALGQLINYSAESLHKHREGGGTPFSKLIEIFDYNNEDVNFLLEQVNISTKDEKDAALMVLANTMCSGEPRIYGNLKRYVIKSFEKEIYTWNNGSEKDFFYWIIKFMTDRSKVLMLVGDHMEKFQSRKPVRMAVSFKNASAVIKLAPFKKKEDEFDENEMVSMLYMLCLKNEAEIIKEITKELNWEAKDVQFYQKAVLKLSKEYKNLAVQEFLKEKRPLGDLLPNLSLLNSRSILVFSQVLEKPDVEKQLISNEADTKNDDNDNFSNVKKSYDLSALPVKKQLSSVYLNNVSFEDFLNDAKCSPVKTEVVENCEKTRGTMSAFLSELLKFAIEGFSLFDFITNLLVLKSFFSTGDVIWATLTIISIVTPYYVSYAPLVTFLILRKNFTVDETWRRKFGYFLLTILCLLFFFLIDIIFWISEIFLSMPFLKRRFRFVDISIDLFFQKAMRLQKTDLEGVRRLRIAAQLIFESVPQLALQLYILIKLDLGINSSLIISVSCAAVHTGLEVFLILSEAKATKTNFFNCIAWLLNGRLGWVPFSEVLARHDKQKEIRLDFGRLEYHFLGSTHNIEYRFTESTIRVLNQTILTLPEYDEAKRPDNLIKLRLGNTCQKVKLRDVYNLLATAENRLNLNTEEVDWQDLFHRSKPLTNKEIEHYFFQFCEIGCMPAVKYLVDSGKIDFSKETEILKSSSSESRTIPLARAISHQHVELVQYLLDNDFGNFIENGFDAVDYTLRTENDALLKLLLLSNKIFISIENRVLIFMKIKTLLKSQDASLTQRAQELIYLLGGPDSPISLSTIRSQLFLENEAEALRQIKDYPEKSIITNQSYSKAFRVLTNSILSVKNFRLNRTFMHEVLSGNPNPTLVLPDEELDDFMLFFFIIEMGGLPRGLTLQQVKTVDRTLERVTLEGSAIQYYSLTANFRVIETKQLLFSEPFKTSNEPSYTAETYNIDYPAFLSRFRFIHYMWSKLLSDDAEIVPENYLILQRVYSQGLYSDQGWGNSSEIAPVIYIESKFKVFYDTFDVYQREMTGRGETVLDYDILSHFQKLNCFAATLSGSKLSIFLNGRSNDGHQTHMNYLRIYFEFVTKKYSDS